MIKQLTLFCSFAILMLAFSGTVTPLQAHCQPEGFPHAPPHPHCPADQLYDVKIFGPNIGSTPYFFYGEGYDWQANTKQVGFNHSDPDGPYGWMELLDFRELFGTDGDKCFPVGQTEIGSVILQKAKRGTAKALIWFWGYTRDQSKEVLYHFEFNGVFDTAKDWPPEVENTLTLSDWELHLGNEGNSIKAISCLSSGEKGDGTFFNNGIEIVVTIAP